MELQAYEKEHLAALREDLASCMVLLKKNGAFPLETPSSLAAYGSGVRHSVKGGTGSGEVNSRFTVNVEQGLKEAGFTLTSGVWLDGYDAIRTAAKESFRKELRAEAHKAGTNVFQYGMGAVMPEPEYELPVVRCADAAIYVLSRISGEGSDRKPIPGDVKLTHAEIQDILALDSLYERFMLVLNVGGPVDLTPVAEVGNILVLSQLGTEMGAALADVLLGKVAPSGRLTTSWAAWEDYCPGIDIGDNEETYYNEGVYVGYRYFTTVGKQPLYPFGYGLSYTDFTLGGFETALEENRVRFRAEVKNVGAFSGREVVQLYVCAPEGKLCKPARTLAGFAKTKKLAPLESETLEIGFDLSELASFDEEQSAYLLEAGDYVLYAGVNCVDAAPAAILRLDTDQILKKVSPVASPALFKEKTYARAPEPPLPDDLPILGIDASKLSRVDPIYELDCAVEPEIEALSDGELAYLAIGSYSETPGLASVIGNAAGHVAGAAGETTSKLADKSIASLVMADGPAGLRLSRDYYADEKGAHAIGGSSIPESMLELMSPTLRKLASFAMGGRTPKRAELRHQYCTTLPIGTAIAQSWDVDFARRCGDLVGEEMERFGVQLWLAPALNIHRSILCGRNFEYFSEDPLLSGRMAAAITRGVQAHRGCAVTIKHLAANNQEYNRYYNNSNVSERALREIYLRGFAICVREAQPHALMTSYNLINGTHSAEMPGLIDGFLRAENGFEGIVMTDWVMQMPKLGSRYPITDPPKVTAAGGDLFMPGRKADRQRLLDALADGTLPRRQLEICCSRVLRMIRRLRG